MFRKQREVKRAWLTPLERLGRMMFKKRVYLLMTQRGLRIRRKELYETVSIAIKGKG